MANAFYIQEEWITNYKLSGNDLLIFARLASFTINVGGYNGSIEWLGHSVGTTKRTAINVLEKLEKIGMIERENKFIKCVFQPLIQGEKSALKGEKISPKAKGEKISPNGAKFSSKGEKISPKYNKEIYTPLKGGVSIIERGAQNTTDTTTEFLFKSFESKISSKQDHDCIAKLASAMTLEQAEVFVDYCNDRKTTLHLGVITQLQDELLRKACEWDAQGRPRKAQKQPEQPPQPTPQMFPQQEMPEISAKSAEIYNKNLWRAQINDCIKNHPKTAKKAWNRQMELTTNISILFPTPCDMQLITNYIEEL
jgi:hypothetical protein